jgi:ATP-dependent RNA helicase DDX49/DBP8
VDSAPKKPVLKSTFESLGLSVQLIRTLAGISIRKPTEIQSACFEPILSGMFSHNPYVRRL